MTHHDARRRHLLSRLGRRLGPAAPALVLVASGAAFQALAEEAPGEPAYTDGQEAPLMLAAAHEGDAEAEAEAEAEGEAEGEEEEEAEGEAEAEG